MNINVHQILEDSRTSSAKGHPDYNVTKLAKIWIKMNLTWRFGYLSTRKCFNGMIGHVMWSCDGLKTTWSRNRELENWFGCRNNQSTSPSVTLVNGSFLVEFSSKPDFLQSTLPKFNPRYNFILNFSFFNLDTSDKGLDGHGHGRSCLSAQLWFNFLTQ